jgi:hypothetical protein
MGILHDKQLSAKLDALFDVGRDFAQAWLSHWLETRAGDQAETSAPAQSEKPLTLDELSARLGRTKRTIREWMSDYGLPSLRAHSKADPLFDWREVLEWMKRHRKINHTEGRGNGKLASQAPIGTRPQAKL